MSCIPKKRLLLRLLTFPFPIRIIPGLCLSIIQFHPILDFVFHQPMELLAIIPGSIFQHPNGTPIYSVSSGTVSYLGFNGANGYTIMISSNNIIFSYSHVSPEFIVKIGDFIKQNQLLGHVGPKYIDSLPNNPYHDSSRRSNKWSNNRLSLTFWRKNRWQSHRPPNIISLITITCHLQNFPSLIQSYFCNLDI